MSNLDNIRRNPMKKLWEIQKVFEAIIAEHKVIDTVTGKRMDAKGSEKTLRLAREGLAMSRIAMPKEE